MRRFATVSIGLLAFLIGAAPVAAASWSHPATITTSHDAFPSYARSLAVAGGVDHLVDSRLTGQIEYRRSTNDGASWSAPTVLAQPDATFTSVLGDPAIAARGSLVVVAYRAHDATAAYLFIRRSLDRGRTWGAPEQVARVVTDRRIGEQSVAISAAGVFLTWTDRSNGEIELRRSVDAGAHFAPVQHIGVTSYTFFPDNPTYTDGLIGLAASGRAVYLAWSPSGNGYADSIVLSRSVDGGSTFLPARTIFVGPSFGWASLAAASGYLVGQFQTPDGNLWMFHSSDRGRHVATHRFAGPGVTSTVFEGSVAVDHEGNALITYNRTKPGVGDAAPIGNILVRRSHDGGRHWSGPAIAAGKVSGPGNIATAFVGDDRTLLVFATCQDSSFSVCDVAEVRGH